MRALSLLVLLAACTAAVPARAACPVPSYLYGGFQPSTPLPVDAAANDTTLANPTCGTTHGRFQIAAGLVLAAAYSSCGGSGPMEIAGLETLVDEDFTVSGPAPGTPVAFDAVFDVHGLVMSFSEPGGGGGGRVRALVRQTPGGEVSVQHATTIVEPYVEVTQSLVLPVTAVAGTPVHLRFATRAETFDGRAELEGTFRFAGLPPGAVVTSCRGYSSDAPVAGRGSSWGRIKTLYR